ncbi:MAG: phenylalanyl-tRNA synthetase subunit beta, phenylalanyl-tRNA synthetase beta chain [Candidatus Peregrinibacteria bacterium GW2011_GWF2_38_29]|nr:MAG: phenylalanyl-tRNA synthetase subunit beta, phenylalanyl-tRNA synthetase beta chain [Candidatus Peregrinibacteria bacterium GW2011_GWF2_38_29]HBB03160.1 phenylalanine--tRNA ligase subunit beta [Candidatus Peregrinibacteria bacterium]
MKISLNWLREFVDIPQDVNAKELAHLFSVKVAEVESVHEEGAEWGNIITGQIIELNPHPNATKLKLATIALSKTKTTILVCGGNNLYEKMYVAVALPGAKARWHGEGDLMELKTVEIRGVKSEGMICAAEEIGIKLSEDSRFKQTPGGILDLTEIKPKLGIPLKEALNRTDVIFEIENKSLTHRPDLWSHYGIAREFAVILGTKLRKATPKVKVPWKGQKMEVEVKNKTLCPRYCGIIIENVDVKQSPEWLAKKLNAVGRGAHNNIVDVTNYVTEELGQPLHAFDINNISEKIIVRTAEDKEKITTLDKEKRILSKEMLVIADKEKPLAIAGVMGGENSGITEKTKTIFIESATFNATSVRKTGTKLNLRTEAVQRFEKSLDPLLAEQGLLRACELILQICPKAHLIGPITDIKNFNEKPLEVEMSVSKTCSKIGAEISAKEMIKILEQLEFKAKMKGKDLIKVTVPSFRATKDVSIAEDLVEEVARIYGYGKIEPILPNIPSKLPIENAERRLEYRARDILSFGLGFTEVQTYSFYGKREITNAKLPQELHIELENHLSEDQTHLRTSLIPNMLKAVEQNIKSFNGFKIYEIGHTFIEHKSFFPIEENYICGIIVENKKTAKNKELFYEAKGAFEAFLSAFGSTELKSEKNTSHHSYTNPAKCISYKTVSENVEQNAIEIATVYELNPVVLKNFGLEDVKIACFEINFTRLAQLNTQKKTYTPIQKFPEIKIDISIVFPKSKTVQEVTKMIESSGALHIKEVELFDVFMDKSLGENSRALAFKITLRSDEKTLTLEEMAEDQKKIFSSLKSNGGIIRGT